MSNVIFQIANRAIQGLRQLETRLAQAIANDNFTAVEKLLRQGANPNSEIKSRPGVPLLFSTFSKNYFTLPQGSMGDRFRTLYHITAKEECLRLLLKYGANPNAKDESDRTPLEIAILWCMPDVVKLLLIYGGDPDFRDSKDMTPLMKSAILGIQDARPIKDKLQIVMHLIDAGAQIDAQSLNGKTALMYATGNSRTEIVELLISSGASLSIKDHQGNQACDIIDRSVTPQQRIYLQNILTQPQLNILKYKYQELIPEGDRLLESIL